MAIIAPNNLFNLQPQDDTTGVLIDPSQLQSAPANVTPAQPGVTAPGAFAGFLADPANVNAIAPYVADRHSIKPQPAPSFFDANSNLLSTPNKGMAPDQAKALASRDTSWFNPNAGQPATQPQVLPPAASGQPFNAPATAQPQATAQIQPQAQPQGVTAPWFTAGRSAQPAPTPDVSGMAGNQGPALPQAQQPVIQSQTQADQAELQRLSKNGAGLNSIQNPALKTLARIADVAGTIFAPGVAAAIPGSTLRNRVLQNQQAGIVKQDQANDENVQNTYARNLQNQAALSTIAKTDAETKNIPLLTRVKQAAAITAAQEHGLKPTFDDNGNPTGGFEVDPDSPVTQKMQAQNDYFSARQELADAQAALAKSKNDPNSAAFKQAQERITVAQKNAQTAAGRLGLSGEQYLMHAYGTDSSGNPLPGAMQAPDGTPVGTAFQGNIKPTGTQRDAAGRAQTGEALRQRIIQQMQDPEIQAGLGPIAGRVSEGKSDVGILSPKMSQFYNDLKSYGAFQAGMHPVKGIGGLQYFDKVMGGLGQTPEQLAGKLQSNAATAQSVMGVGTPPLAGGRGKGGNASGGTLPPQAASQLKEGHNTTFGNGQVWTLKNGQQQRIK